jgi:hypothetical protein
VALEEVKAECRRQNAERVWPLAFALWLLASGCAVNFGRSGTATATADETKSLHGTNRVVDVKVGK